MFTIAGLLLACLAPAGSESVDLTGRLTAIPDDGMGRFGVVDPQSALLSPEKPAEIKNAPERPGLLWARFQFGPSDKLTGITVAIDESNAAAPLVWIDANANNDMTDDPEAKWQEVKSADSAGTITAHETFVKMPATAGALEGRTVRVFRFLPDQALARRLSPLAIYASLQSGVQGDLFVDSKRYATALLDRSATGDYTHPNGRSSALVLLLDANGDGNFGAGERYPIEKSFKLNDGWYQVESIAPDGTEIKLKKAPSPAEIAKRTAAPAVGDIAPAFTGPGLDGKPVNFPGDYRGKLVLVDFWATWCGPCVGEMPNVKKVYDKYHDKGLEVLGISFDKPGQSAAVKKFAEARKLPWRHVYEGKFWSTDVGQQWNINSIPAAFLIDGDTGKIVAAGPTLRGPNLDAAVGLEIKNKFRDPAAP